MLQRISKRQQKKNQRNSSFNDAKLFWNFLKKVWNFSNHKREQRLKSLKIYEFWNARKKAKILRS